MTRLTPDQRQLVTELLHSDLPPAQVVAEAAATDDAIVTWLAEVYVASHRFVSAVGSKTTPAAEVRTSPDALRLAQGRHPTNLRECSWCGGQGVVAGLVVSDDLDVPTVDEVCRRCGGRGSVA